MIDENSELVKNVHAPRFTGSFGQNLKLRFITLSVHEFPEIDRSKISKLVAIFFTPENENNSNQSCKHDTNDRLIDLITAVSMIA